MGLVKVSNPPTGDLGWVVGAPKLGHLSDCAFLVQNLGAKDIDDLRLRTDINRRAERRRSGRGAEETGAGKVFRETASGAKADRPQLRRVLEELDAGHVPDGDAARPPGAVHPRPVEHARGDHREESRRSLADAWADTTTSHGRLMLTVLGGLAEFERDLIRTRTGEGRAQAVARGQRIGPTAVAHPASAERGDQAPRAGRNLAEIGRSYNVSTATISRLTA
jgi:hypothetical protein